MQRIEDKRLLSLRGILYLNEKEYANFPHKDKISFELSKTITSEINSLVASEIILKTRRGFMMPYDLGILKIQKRVNKKLVQHPSFAKIAEIERPFNFHSDGYLYKVYFIKKVAGLFVYSGARGMKPKRLHTVFDKNYLYEYGLCFDAHRDNINRPMAQLIIHNTLPFVADIHDLKTSIELNGVQTEKVKKKYLKFKADGPTRK